MKKWWFSILMFVVALGIMVFSIVSLCFDEYLHLIASAECNYATLSLFIVIIGVATLPRKDDKDEKED